MSTWVKVPVPPEIAELPTSMDPCPSDMEPLLTTPVVTRELSPTYAVASLRLNAGVVSDPPSVNVTPP